MHEALVIIPARMASTRLPGKPLALLAGRPMIAHAVSCALAAAIGPVLVATDTPAIARAAQEAGAAAIVTREDHVSGTDRVAEALALADPARHHAIVVNLQGDEPELKPAALRSLLAVLEDRIVDIATLATPLDPDDAADPNAVKVWGRAIGPGLIEASAFARHSPADVPAWRHVGVYAYRRAALERFVALAPSAAEMRERLEQLRALEAGMRIVAALVEKTPRGVDTPTDLAAVRARLAGVPWP